MVDLWICAPRVFSSMEGGDGRNCHPVDDRGRTEWEPVSPPPIAHRTMVETPGTHSTRNRPSKGTDGGADRSVCCLPLEIPTSRTARRRVRSPLSQWVP
jgi:hypothetical protein